MIQPEKLWGNELLRSVWYSKSKPFIPLVAYKSALKAAFSRTTLNNVGDRTSVSRLEIKPQQQILQKKVVPAPNFSEFHLKNCNLATSKRPCLQIRPCPLKFHMNRTFPKNDSCHSETKRPQIITRCPWMRLTSNRSSPFAIVKDSQFSKNFSGSHAAQLLPIFRYFHFTV